MYSFSELSLLFEEKFNKRHFPQEPNTLYDPSQYILQPGGKRVRPVLCLMGNELVNDINPDAYHVAMAIELFHNFTLIHDDIMDKAPLRRGMETVHAKYGTSTALLSGDVMLVTAYEYLTKINIGTIHKILQLFNTTARQVCEGQQKDMDFEKSANVTFEQYVDMIQLKTSVLLAASLQMGGILGGAGKGNQQHLYEFGKNLGIAFQIQDDYLDAYGDPGKFGKQVGGDILSNKKTFLLIHALEVAKQSDLDEINEIIISNPQDKVAKILKIYDRCEVAKWANELKEKYYTTALNNMEEIAILSKRKKPLIDLAKYLLNREF